MLQNLWERKSLHTKLNGMVFCLRLEVLTMMAMTIVFRDISPYSINRRLPSFWRTVLLPSSGMNIQLFKQAESKIMILCSYFLSSLEYDISYFLSNITSQRICTCLVGTVHQSHSRKDKLKLWFSFDLGGEFRNRIWNYANIHLSPGFALKNVPAYHFRVIMNLEKRLKIRKNITKHFSWR
jgi:hypothetical protein